MKTRIIRGRTKRLPIEFVEHINNAIRISNAELDKAPEPQHGATWSHPFNGREYKYDSKKHLYVWTGKTHIPMFS